MRRLRSRQGSSRRRTCPEGIGRAIGLRMVADCAAVAHPASALADLEALTETCGGPAVHLDVTDGDSCSARPSAAKWSAARLAS